MKVIHIFPDDKFAKYIYKQFEQLQIQNEYFVFSEKNSLDFVSFPSTRTSIKEIDSKLINYINSFDALFIHYLGPEARKLLSLKGLDVKTFWIGWGGDYYWLINDLNNFELYKPLTYKKKYFFPYFSFFNEFFKGFKKVYHSPNRKVLNKIDYFSPVIKSEFEIIKKDYSFNFKHFEWNYGNMEEDLVPDNLNLDVDANSVLVGNSATYTNNFFDVFQELKVLKLQQDIFCPLTYGDIKLKKEIINEGKKCFEHFIPIVDHLNYPDYLDLLKRCRNVIMGHKRQQALGTVLTMIYIGSNIFLYKDSFLYNYFHSIGIRVFSIEDLLENGNLLIFKISSKELISIRKLLVQHWGKDFNTNNGLKISALIDKN